MLTEKVLVVSLTPLVVSAPLKAHPTSPPAQASLPRMELRSGTRKGNMAAQRQGTPSPPKSDSPPVNQALIPAPATPALVPRKDIQELVNTGDPLNRRPQPSIPFFTEEGAAGQGGPLGSSLGLGGAVV